MARLSDMPDEILLIITSHIIDDDIHRTPAQKLISLAKTCQKLHQFTVPLIYSAISLDMGDGTSFFKPEPFQNIYPDAPDVIQQLAFTLEDRLVRSMVKKVDLMGHNLRTNFMHGLEILLSLLPNLHTLSVEVYAEVYDEPQSKSDIPLYVADHIFSPLRISNALANVSGTLKHLKIHLHNEASLGETPFDPVFLPTSAWDLSVMQALNDFHQLEVLELTIGAAFDFLGDPCAERLLAELLPPNLKTFKVEFTSLAYPPHPTNWIVSFLLDEVSKRRVRGHLLALREITFEIPRFRLWGECWVDEEESGWENSCLKSTTEEIREIGTTPYLIWAGEKMTFPDLAAFLFDED